MCEFFAQLEAAVALWGVATVPQRQFEQCLFVPCNCGHFCVNFHLQHFLTL